MAKKQTRRSVSIRGATYEQIKRYCDRNGLSMSEFVEDRISTFFGNGGCRSAMDDESRDMSEEELKDAARLFTF